MRYRDLGLSVIPLKYGDKRPIIEWKEYQERIPSEDEVKEWFSKDKVNIAIVCGRVSGNLVVLDFDDMDTFKEWYERVDKEHPDLRDLILKTWMVETGKGIHVYFRLKDPSLVPRTKPKVEKKPIDIKGEGGYVVAPPSLHPSGKQYLFRMGNPNDEIAVIEDPRLWSELLETIGVEREDRSRGIEHRTSFKMLDDGTLITFKELLKDAWVEGQRQYLALFLSGWFAKARIHPLGLAKLFRIIAEDRTDEELDKRLSTIYYSYRKVYGNIPELEELDRLVESWKAEGIIKENVSRGVSRDLEEKVKGKSGVQEILEATLGEERALDIIRQIEETLEVSSPFKDSIFELLDYDKQLYAVANLRKMVIARVKRVDGRIIYKERVAPVAPVKVVVHENPLGGIRKYEVVFEGRTLIKPLKVGPAPIEEIVARLKAEGLVYHRRLIDDVLNAVIQGFIKKGKAEIKEELEAPGFYLVDNKILAVKWEPKEVSREELKEALELLNELATKWYNHAIDKFATSIKWGIISPFIYARKQLGSQYQVPHLTMYGARNTGKTTLAQISTVYLWGLDKGTHSVSGSQANTEARLGRVVSRSTFPQIINEANSMFYKPEVINVLKNTVEELIARGKYVRNEWREYLALSPLVITLNPQPPVDFERLELVPKTTWLLYFTEGERLRQEQIENFRREVEPRLYKLGAIGHYIARLILERGPEILKKDWRKLGKELLIEAYRGAGLNPPEWIGGEYEVESFEDIERDKIERIRSKFIKYINEQYSRNIGKIIADYGYDGRLEKIDIEDVSIVDKLNILLKNKLIPFMIMKKGKVYITSSIIGELGIEVDSLKSLADLLGWIYCKKKSFRYGNKETSFSVIETSIEELQGFLEFEIVED